MTDNNKLDVKVIFDIIEPKSKVVDLGCGDGTLLHMLADKKQAKVQGIELDENQIYQCVEKGVSVFHGDIETGLSDYPDKSFDYVILNQSMQEIKNVIFVIEEALRVGKKVIIGFSNFAYYRARFRMFLRGKTPITASLPYRWYDTPNVHFLSITDFSLFCANQKITVLKEYYLGKKKNIKILPNLFALNAIFVITK